MTRTVHSPSTDPRTFEPIRTLLGNRRRRHAVAALAEREPPFPLGDLAGAVAARESDDGPPDTDAVALALHHVHLPALADAGVVDYDAATNVVAAVRREPLVPFLET